MPFDIGGVIFNGSSADVKDYKNIITRGLAFYVDASALESYSRSGTLWYDLGSSNATSTLTNGPTFSTDGGGSILLDGNNDYAVTNNVSLAYSGYTMECAVKYTSVSGNQGLFSYSQSGAGKYINLYKANGAGMRWETNAGQAITGTNNLTSGVWYYFTGVWDGANGYLYRNATLETSAAMSSHTSQTSTFDIGTYAGVTNGNIGFARFYTRALTSAEITHNFNIQRGRFGL